MRHDFLRIISLLFATASIALAAEFDLRKPVRIESGLVEGVPNAEGSVVAFKGIPYAAPPVDSLRWREPQPPLQWEGVRKADQFGASCVQPVNACTPPYTAEFSVTGPMSEDCLFINIWTPAKTADDKLAVLFYIHGGSGTHGSGGVSVYDGEELARKGIIVVTFNFRLGILAGMGYPQLTAESRDHVCGNYGMSDMIAALKWVQTNIAVFGGDPAKVTICGQSSGSMALHYLTSSPRTKGLFRGAIAASFSYDYLTKKHSVGNVWQKEQEGLKFAVAKGAKSLDDLRKIPAQELISQDSKVAPFTRSCLSASVNTDGRTFLYEYTDALDRGLENDVPMLSGITIDDAGAGPPVKYIKTTAANFAASAPQMFGEKKLAFQALQEKFLALFPVTTDQAARETVKQVQVEYRLASVFYWAKRRAEKSRAPVYTYLFEQSIPWPEHPEFGAFHSSDLVFWFNNLKMFSRPWTEDDHHVADQASSYWVNFVKTGNPNGTGLPGWKRFDAAAPETMSVGVNSGPRSISTKERFEFYRELIEK